MSLMPGARVGAYEIIATVGEGGMGQVYRARDTKLQRDVALKTLLPAVAGDPDRLARFKREAQVLAALNHPNIAQIHGLEDAGPTPALVMEFVEGPTLADRIHAGAVPIDEALAIARQIADALEAAHELGIVHRDLKPANVKVRPDGTVKVLDFGLAKAIDPASASGADAMNSPTLTARATQMGTIIGTAAYMSPEQARGKPVDRRADIWAFGVVLYEMLAGRRAFDGEDVSVTLANVIKDDVDWSALPADLPAPVRRLLRRCLEKDPRKRLSAIGDARLELDEREGASGAGTTSATASTPVSRPASLASRLSAWLWPMAAGILITAAVAALFWPRGRTTTTAPLTRLAILPPPGEEIYPDSNGVAISPDGSMVAFVVGTVTRSHSELWVRSLDSPAARRLEDADGAVLPFWSPDGRRIGFATNTKLKTIATTGGRADTLADAPGPRGGAWSPLGVILFAPDFAGPLYKVSASGGPVEPATTLDPARKENGHRFPTFLPDGEHFLYATLPGKEGRFDIFAGSLKDQSRTFVASLESAPVYAEPGWLLYARQGVLAALPFDARALKVTGEPVLLGDEPTNILDPATSFTAGFATSVSAAGSLAYFSSPSTNTIANWYDTTGQSTGTLALPPGHYETVKISPDGTRAVFVRSTSPSESTLWLMDLVRGSSMPLSSGRGRNDAPVWSADGKRIVFAADRAGPQNVYVKNVDDAAPEQLLYESDVLFKIPMSWSPDGRWITVEQLDPGTAQNIWRLPADGGQMTLLVRGPQRDRPGPISPNGRWQAYASDETGRFEVYVQPFPEPGRRIQVSQQGALSAWWSRDGRELLMLSADLRLSRVDVDTGAEFRAGVPQQLAKFPAGILWMDPTPDLKRFLAIEPERTGIGSITVVQNWRAALEKAR